jgi:hypothetical protein
MSVCTPAYDRLILENLSKVVSLASVGVLYVSTLMPELSVTVQVNLFLHIQYCL